MTGRQRHPLRRTRPLPTTGAKVARDSSFRPVDPPAPSTGPGRQFRKVSGPAPFGSSRCTPCGAPPVAYRVMLTSWTWRIAGHEGIEWAFDTGDVFMTCPVDESLFHHGRWRQLAGRRMDAGVPVAPNLRDAVLTEMAAFYMRLNDHLSPPVGSVDEALIVGTVLVASEWLR